MKYLALALSLFAGLVHAQGSNYFVPGCALTGSATSQVVNLAASGCIVGNLPVTNLFSGTGASATTYLSGTGWSTPAGVPGGSSTQVQYNNAGAFAGNQGLTWSVSSNALLVGNYSTSSSGTVTIGGTTTGTGTVKSGGGQMTVQGSPLILTTTGGGALNLAGSVGTGASAGSTISITAGNTGTSSTSAGGAVTVTAGTGNATASGGSVNIVGGAGYSTTGNAGNVAIQGGLGSTSTQSGAVTIATNNTTRLTVANDGGITTAGQTDEGAGSVNANALYQQGIRVVKTAFGALTTPGSGATCSTAFGQGIGGCSSTGAGNANFSFTSGFFTTVPVCTFTVDVHTQTIDILGFSTSGFNITTYTSGTPASASLTAICVGF